MATPPHPHGPAPDGPDPSSGTPGPDLPSPQSLPPVRLPLPDPGQPSGPFPPVGGPPPGYLPPGYPPSGYPPSGYPPPAGPPGYPPPGYPGQDYPPPYPGPAAAPMPPYPGPLMAPQPGSVPLRPLTVGEMITGTVATIRRNPLATLLPAAIVSLAQQVISAVFVFVYIAVFGFHDNRNSVDVVADVTAFVLLGVMSAALAGILTVVVAQDVLGRTTTLGAAWQQVRSRIWALLGLALLTGLLQSLGLLLFVVPGVWLWGIWAVATPALVMERIGIRAALGRSQALVRGTFWRVWGIRALSVLIAESVAIAAALIVAAPAAGADVETFGGWAAYYIASSLGAVIAGTLTAPFVAGMLALLYVDLRMRKEGLDAVLRQAAGYRPQR